MWRPVRPLERDRELDALRSVIAHAQNGRGQACVVEGPSGIGKSYLLDEAAALAADAGLTVLRARGSELTRELAFGMAVELVEARLVRATAEERRDLLSGPAVLAEPTVSRRTQQTDHTAITDEFTVIHGLYWLMVNLAGHGPFALLADDAQWADPGSLRFLAYLGERLDDLPIALLTAVRTDDPATESSLVSLLWETSAAPAIRPAELSRQAVGELLAAGLGRTVDDAVIDTVNHETGGNPFLVNEVVVELREESDLTAATTGSLRTPHSVRRQIARRLARMGPDARALAKAAAVLGDRTALAVVTRLAALPPAQAVTAAEQLVAADIFAKADPASFAHPMIRSATYASLEPGEKPEAHGRAAKLLAATGTDPEVTARHLLEATPTDEAWVTGILHAAAQAAARKGSPATAIRYLRRALDTARQDSVSPRLLIDLGLNEAAAGQTTSLQRFEQAMLLIDEPTQRAEALYSLGQTLYRYGRYEEAAAAFRRGAQLFEDGDLQVRRRFQASSMCAEYFLAPMHRHVDLFDAADLATPPQGAGDRAMLAIQALHESLTVPPAARAGALAGLALADGRLLSEQTSESPVVHLVVLPLLYAGELADAEHHIDAVLTDARGRGASLAFAEASLMRAMVCYAAGRVNDAMVDAQIAVDGMNRGWHALAPTALATLVHCMIERGELDQAADMLSRAEHELAPPKALGINAWFYVARARLRLWRRENAAAQTDLDAAVQSLRDYGMINPAVLPWRPLACMVAAAAGDTRRARELIESEIELAERFQTPVSLGAALRRRALVHEPREALDTLTEAVAVLEKTGARLELARALTDLGVHLRRAGSRVAAREPLTRALDLAHRGGATALAKRAREELLAAGARPRRPARVGAESLTPTERRVAELAASGQDNRSIAELTFVSRNTVAWHLRNVFRKLAVDSREALAEALAD
jgi:DNA-binding CsgD family transcriptional regulator